MATEIRMPRIGHSMTEGTVVVWHGMPGEAVRAGEVIVTIETDKAEYEVEAPVDGVLSDPLVRESEVAAVGAVLGWVLAPGEAHPGTGAGAPRSPAPARSETAASGTARTEPPAAGGRVRASPKARRLAEERGLDLAAIRGSGPGGLVTEADVERAASAPSAASAAAAAAAEARPGRLVRERRRLPPIRRATARRLAEAWASVPHIVQMIDVDVGEVRRLRLRWKGEESEAAGISYNDFIVNAVALALAGHPEWNATVDGDELVLFEDVNAGIAVDTPRGLVVPVVRNADRLSLLEIARESRRLAEKARGPGLEAGDFGAGSFTVSNLGGFGIRAGTPVLNPPESLLVFVGAVEERAVVRDGEIVPRPIVTLSIAYDHRVGDGAAAARVTRRIRDLLQDPVPWADAAAAAEGGKPGE